MNRTYERKQALTFPVTAYASTLSASLALGQFFRRRPPTGSLMAFVSNPVCSAWETTENSNKATGASNHERTRLWILKMRKPPGHRLHYLNVKDLLVSFAVILKRPNKGFPDGKMHGLENLFGEDGGFERFKRFRWVFNLPPLKWVIYVHPIIVRAVVFQSNECASLHPPEWSGRRYH